MHTHKATIYHTAVLFVLIVIAGLSIRIQSASAQKTATTPKPSSSPAASVRPSPTPQASATDGPTSKETIEEIKRRIEKNSDLVKGVTDTATKQVGHVGEISRVTDESITVKTQSATLIMSLSSSVELKAGNKTITPKDIAVGNWASIIGVESDDTFTPDRISVSTETLRPKPQEVALGTIAKISKTELEFTPRGGTESKTYTLTKTSKYQDSDGAKAALADFQTDVAILLVATQNDDAWEVSTIRSLVPLEEEK